MRILFATPHLPPKGGLERYALTVAKRLTRHGHDITLLGHAQAPVDEVREGVRMVGVPPALRLSNTPLGLGIARAARDLIRETSPHVVDVHTPVPGTAELVAWSAARAGIPHVVTYHAGRLEGPGLLGVAARLHAWSAERWMLTRAAGRIAVSPYVAENVFGARGSVVIPPGVDAERFSRVADPVPGRILFVGPVDRAYAWKGLQVLVDAFCRLAPSTDAHLRIIGNGDLVEHHRNAAKALGLASRISILPRVGDSELVREYCEADVVVLPSISPAESFGMVLAEANACGRPVIGSDIGGIPSFVTPGVNGHLVPPGDVAALAARIKAVLGDPAEAARLGEAGRTRVLRDHRWDVVARRTELALTGASGRAG